MAPDRRPRPVQPRRLPDKDRLEAHRQLYDISTGLPYAQRRLGELELSARYGRDFTVYAAGAARMLGDLAVRLGLPPDETVDRAEEIASGVCAAAESEAETLPVAEQSLDRVGLFLERLTRRSQQCLATVHAARQELKARRQQ